MKIKYPPLTLFFSVDKLIFNLIYKKKNLDRCSQQIKEILEILATTNAYNFINFFDII